MSYFIYTGDNDLGIIGYATVSGIEKRRGSWFLLPGFDLNRCRTLLAHPIPAKVVRGWVPYPRRNVIDLAPFEAQLCPLLPW